MSTSGKKEIKRTAKIYFEDGTFVEVEVQKIHEAAGVETYVAKDVSVHNLTGTWTPNQEFRYGWPYPWTPDGVYPYGYKTERNLTDIYNILWWILQELKRIGRREGEAVTQGESAPQESEELPRADSDDSTGTGK